MANALYDKARQKFLNGDLSWRDDDIKAVLVDTALYAVDIANDEFLDDIAALARVATLDTNFASKASGTGIASAANITFGSVSGATIEALVIYVDTGDAATSSLIAFIDSATGLPVTPNGGDIIVQWDTGTDKIFKL